MFCFSCSKYRIYIIPRQKSKQEDLQLEPWLKSLNPTVIYETSDLFWQYRFGETLMQACRLFEEVSERSSSKCRKQHDVKETLAGCKLPLIFLAMLASVTGLDEQSEGCLLNMSWLIKCISCNLCAHSRVLPCVRVVSARHQSERMPSADWDLSYSVVAFRLRVLFCLCVTSD